MRRPLVLTCWLCLLALLAALAVTGLGRDALAAWPPDESQGPVDYSSPSNWPNDPDYAGNWQLWSFLPSQVAHRAGVSDENKRLGSGAHVDQAWAKTTGDPRVLITVMDSGANWSNDDLTFKWFINKGEVPMPDPACTGPNMNDYDRNGDGHFDIRDYTTCGPTDVPAFSKVCDPRLIASGDANKNGIIDPYDLIVAFSDGTDADGNGYVDDISGWDFFHNDNNADDDTRFGHGDGEANWSSRQGNNGRGGIGTCPDCTVMMLRVGDSFVTDSNMFGMAVTYAVDNGTSVIQEALGTLNNTPLSRKAIDYAYDNDVTVVASAADENSFHHNMPGTNNHTFYVHPVTYDASSWESATTFLNYNNCSNYGAQLALSVPGGACSSEATGRMAGMAGLVYSMALKDDLPLRKATRGDPDGNRRLSAEEVMQVVKEGVDDLYDPADAMDPLKFPTRIGWEARFGYGRVNARKAVDAVDKGAIPPEVEIRSPLWFDVIHPDRTPQVVIDGRVEIGHKEAGDTFDYVLEWAPGVEPDDSAFKTIAQGTMVADKIDGPLGMWDVSNLTVDNPPQGSPDYGTNRRTVTLRLRAVIHSLDANRDGAKGEYRKAVEVDRDPDLLPGFPINLGTSAEGSPIIEDLNGDGKRELILGDSAGLVHAFEADGSELPGWPVKLGLIPSMDPALGADHRDSPAFATGGFDPDVHSSSGTSIAVGDLDGDGQPEVVAADFDGKVYVFHADGSIMKGWPFTIDRTTSQTVGRQRTIYEGIWAAPALADFDGDGKPEIVIATQNSLLYVLKSDGTPLPTFHGGQPVTVWDTRLPDDPNADTPRVRDRMFSSPALGDLNGDGVPDIVVGTNENYDNSGRLYAIDGKTGDYLPGWPINVVSNYILPFVGSGVPNSPALGDLDGDGVPEIVVGGIAGGLRVYRADGKNFTNGTFGGTFPNNREKYGALSKAQNEVSVTLVANASIGDVNDDGTLDVVQPTGGGDAALSFAAGGQRRDFEHHVAAWDTATGQFLPGFPALIEDWQFFNTATIADIDGDGHSEILEGSGGYWVHAFNADGKEPSGFPKLTGGWITASVAVGDIDGDGKLDFAVGTRDGYLYAWKGKGPVDGRVDWASFGHDPGNTRNYDTKLDQGGAKGTPPAAQPDGGTMMETVTQGGGCSCSLARHGSGSRSGFAVFGVILAAAVLERRRRRSR